MCCTAGFELPSLWEHSQMSKWITLMWDLTGGLCHVFFIMTGRRHHYPGEQCRSGAWEESDG